MSKRESKYAKLRKDPDVERWLKEIARGSLITRDTYLRRLGSFCDTMGKTPRELIEMNDRNLTNLISDYITNMEESTYTRRDKKKVKYKGKYISGSVKAVMSWLSYNNKKLIRKLKFTSGGDSVNERVPTRDELKKVLGSGDPRERLACSLMSFSGLRPEVLGNYLGTDGLKLADFPEVKIMKGKVEFERIPTLIKVRPSLSKSRRQYFSFLGQEGCFYFKAYLEERINSGESIDGDSAIITPSKLKLRNAKKHIRSINIGDLIRGAIRKAGFTWRPYILRAYFDTQLMLSESRGLILRDYRQFMMGQVGDIEHAYTLNKGSLKEETVEDLRSSYEKSLRYLETEKREISEEEKEKWKVEFKREYLKLFFDDKEIDDNRLLELPTEEMQKKIKEKMGMSMNNGHSQKVIPLKEVREYIEKGWEFVQGISSKEAIVRIPK